MAISVPNIPYEPTPSVLPQGGGTPAVHVNAPGAAFGENIGRAIEGFGSTIGKVGDELFNRAIEIQGLRNETEANDATTKFMLDAAKNQEGFKDLEGKAASDGLNKHLDGLNQMRQQARGALSSDAVRKMFDSQTLSDFRYMTVNSMGHASSQLKKYNNDAATATIEQKMFEVSGRPMEDAEFDLKRQGVNDTIDKLYGGKESPEKIAARKQELKSRLQAARVMGTATQNVAGAMDQLEKVRQDIGGEKYANIHDHLTNRLMPIAAESANKNTIAGRMPGLSPEQNSVFDHTESHLAAVANWAGLNNPGEKFSAENADGNRGLMIDTKNPDGLVAIIQKEANDQGVPINIGIEDGRVHVSLPAELDVSTLQDSRKVTEAESIKFSREYLMGKYPKMERIGEVSDRTGMTAWNRQRALDHDQTQHRMTSVYNVIHPADGQRLRTVEEVRQALIKSQGNADAYDKLDGKDRAAIDKHLASKSAMKNDQDEYWRWINKTPEELYYTDPKELINNEKLTDATKDVFLKAMVKAQSAEGKAPAVGRIKAQMESYIPDTMDKDEKNAYFGQLESWVMDYTAEHKAPPKPAESLEMGQVMLMNRVKPGVFGMALGGTKEQLFKAVPTEEEFKTAAQDPYWEGRRPTQEAVIRHWRNQLIQKYHEGPEKNVAVMDAKPAAAPGAVGRPAAAAPAPETAIVPAATTEPVHPEVPEPRAARRAQREAAQAKVEAQQAKEREAAEAERQEGIRQSEAAREKYQSALVAARGKTEASRAAEPQKQADEAKRNYIDTLKKREKALIGRPGDPVTPSIRRELERVRSQIESLEK